MTESLKKNLKNNFRIAFIRCDCDSEILVVRYDAELDMADLCIYEGKNSFKHKHSWYQRFRYMWYYLVNGYPYADQIMLNRDQIKELAGFLSTI